MEKISVTILGCGSALPTKYCFSSSQLLRMNEKLFMIDCGAGAQIRMRQMDVKTGRLNHIFISHLHGDHCFGLIGLISTLNLMGRTADLYIHAAEDLERLLRPLIDYFCAEAGFKVIFDPINPRKHELIYESRALQVHSIPLKHRVPTCGFLFREKEKDRHIRREMIDFYQIPVKDIVRIKQGEDFLTPDGTFLPNDRLTTLPTPPRSYAYCSDTAYSEKIVSMIEGVDCLYHESTFAEADAARAKQTLHSTARQAAEIASAANVKQLILGHFSARYNGNHAQLLAEAQAVFPNTMLAEDRKTFYF